MAGAAAVSLAPFDALAAGYDAGFTESVLGRLLREAVWRRIDTHFAPGQRVLDLGCGTGEDALHLAQRGLRVVGLDAAAAMVSEAEQKARRQGLEAQTSFRTQTLEAWAAHRDAQEPAAFDGALTNFGVLNCVEDLAAVAAALARAVRPGGRVVLVVMGPLVPWEWCWHLFRGAPSTAFRRLRRGGVRWRGLVVRYPSPRTLERSFRPTFRRLRLSALGALLPPSEAAALVARQPRFFTALARLEGCCGHWPPLPWLADHYLLELERVEEA